jgi:hypothetical protein
LTRCHFFIRWKNRKAEQVLSGGIGNTGKRKGNCAGGWIWCKYCVPMYVNGKMRPVKTIPKIGERSIKENDGKGEFKYDILNICKDFCDCHNVPLAQQ